MIAIDPGSEKSAFLGYSNGEIGVMGIVDNEELVQRLRGTICQHPDKPVVIEWIETFGMSVGKDTFETVYWIGRFSEAVGGEDARVTRRQVKMTLCGHLKATDTNVRQALIDLFGGVGGKEAAVGTKGSPGPLYGVKSHLWSALAVAVTYERMQMDI